MSSLKEKIGKEKCKVKDELSMKLIYKRKDCNEINLKWMTYKLKYMLE